MGETLTREQIDDIERDTLDREHQEDSTTIEALCAMARAYINDGAARHADHEEIERCHDVIREGSELLATARRELAEALESAGANAEALLLARRELGEVREAAQAVREAVGKATIAIGGNGVRAALDRLAAALGKERWNG